MKERIVYPVATVLALLLFAGCGSEEGGHSAPAVAPRILEDVSLARVERRSADVLRPLAGIVQARSVTHVSARIMAQIESISVEEGRRVRKGDLLAKLDSREFVAKVGQVEGALAQATAQLDLAVLTKDRYQALLDGKAVSPQEYDTVAAQEKTARQAVSQAEAALSEAKTYLTFTKIHSPVDGGVVRRHLDPGTMAAPGVPLLTLEEAAYRVEVAVDSAYSGSIRIGSPLQVKVESAGFSGTAKVTEMMPAVDPLSRTFTVRADLPSLGSLRSGQYARVTLPLGSREVLAIPEGARVQRGQMDGVYLVADDGTISFRLIKAGDLLGAGRLEVLAGLDEGDAVVAANTDRVQEGDRVRPE